MSPHSRQPHWHDTIAMRFKRCPCAHGATTSVPSTHRHMKAQRTFRPFRHVCGIARAAHPSTFSFMDTVVSGTFLAVCLYGVPYCSVHPMPASHATSHLRVLHTPNTSSTPPPGSGRRSRVLYSFWHLQSATSKQ